MPFFKPAAGCGAAGSVTIGPWSSALVKRNRNLIDKTIKSSVIRSPLIGPAKALRGAETQ